MYGPQSNGISFLPTRKQATVLICICHSEQLEHQQTLSCWLHGTAFARYRTGSTFALTHALDDIARKHAERVCVFARFPERNGALGRKNTVHEEAFLQQLDFP